MRKFDTHSHILEWSSEEVVVPYRSPKDGKIHRYYPDFIIKKRNRDGTVSIVMIEVKPSSQARKPKSTSKSRRQLNERLTYEVNNAKWEAADAFCQNRGWKFIVLTEKHLPVA